MRLLYCRWCDAGIHLSIICRQWWSPKEHVGIINLLVEFNNIQQTGWYKHVSWNIRNCIKLDTSRILASYPWKGNGTHLVLWTRSLVVVTLHPRLMLALGGNEDSKRTRTHSRCAAQRIIANHRGNRAGCQSYTSGKLDLIVHFLRVRLYLALTANVATNS